MTPIIEIHNLKKHFPPTKGTKEGFIAVNGINLTIERGEIFSLLGPNGAGKTTTISIMSELLTPTEGDARLDDKSTVRGSIEVKKRHRRGAAGNRVIPDLSASANLEFFGRS